MAQIVDEGDFRLPSEFLPEDFFLGEETSHIDGFFFQSSSFDDYEPSNLNSTVESTTETESDDDSYTAGLTRQMTRAFFLHDDEEQDIDLSTSPVSSSTQNNSKRLATSPESALCSTVEWKKLSAKVSFPPFHEQDIDNDDNNNMKKSPNNSSTRAWEDLLSAAAAAADGHASIMRREVELQKRRVAHHLGIHGFDGSESRPPLVSISQSNNNISIRYYGNPALTHHQLQVSQFYQLRHQQMLKQRHQQHLHQCSLAWGRQTGEFEGVGANLPAVNNKKSVAVGKLSGRPVGFSSSAWPPPPLQPHHHPNQLQQQVLRQGFGTRAVFLSSPAPPKQSCGGTGVFLPRRAGSPNADFRKRSGCSTVLLPEKVVQALNLDLDKMGPHHRSPGGFLLDPRRENMMARNKPVWLQKQSVGPRQSPTAAMNRRQYGRSPATQTTVDLLLIHYFTSLVYCYYLFVVF